MKKHLDPIPKHGDNRGFLIEFLREDENILNFKGQMYASTIGCGEIRGNHYHNEKTEIFCVIKGTLRVLIQHIDSKEIEEHILSSDIKNLERIIVQPKFAHSFTNIGESEAILLAYGDYVHDHVNPDQFKFIIIG